MEIPICVTDAHTFIDRIHEIKSWVYGGQLRLIVPSSLPENVEALHKKSIEPKPARKETPKTKTLGKPAKKEYPTFDANPLVAKAFLARLEAGKSYQTGAYGRPIYAKEENHAAVHFAPAKEQYSAWKNVEEVEEQAKLPTDGARSWADRLRRKQNLVNGNTESKAEGPVKPKLVAKIGADNSPWKVQKNTPTISGTDVPANLRPMMSCSLWRIHDSIHRNDENQVFVLTGQPNVKDVATKLNIIVRSPAELADLITASKASVDISRFGELERDFGVHPVKERRPIRCTAAVGSISRVTNGDVERKDKPGLEIEDLKDMTDDVGLAMDVKSRVALATDGPEVQQKQDEQQALQLAEELRLADNPSRRGNLPNGLGAAEIIDGTAGSSNYLTSEGSEIEIAESVMANSIVNALGEVVVDYATKSHERAKSPADLSYEDAQGPSLDTIRQAANNVWTRSFAEALSGHQARKSPPLPERKGTGKPDSNGLPPKPPNAWAQPLQPTPPKPSNVPNATTIGAQTPKIEQVQRRPSTPLNAQDSPDSDEEIVVFQPKRLSAQRKPAQQSSRPTTPNLQPQPAPITKTAPPNQTSHASVSAKQTTPKITPKQKYIANKAVNGASNVSLPVNAKQLPVIDPDAFGRDFAVNTNSNGKVIMRGGRPRHSPQPSLFDAGASTSRPGSSHRPHRKSPSRPSPKASPRETVRVPAQTDRPTINAERQQTPPTSFPRSTNAVPPKQMPIGTGRPSAATPPEPSLQPAPTISPMHSFGTPTSMPTLNANAPIFQPGGMGSSLLQPPLQREEPHGPAPPMQPPIGSGRPSSKSSQQKAPEPVILSTNTTDGPAHPGPSLPRDLVVPTPTGPRNREHNVARRPNIQGPQNFASRGPNPGLAQPRHTVSMDRKPSGPLNHQNGDFRPQGARLGAGRPVKPSLFDPELDHTRAYQPDTIETKESAVPEVRYVLKSGSTREEARGKGKLWVG